METCGCLWVSMYFYFPSQTSPKHNFHSLGDGDNTIIICDYSRPYYLKRGRDADKEAKEAAGYAFYFLFGI